MSEHKEHEHHHEGKKHHHEEEAAVSVVTPAGVFPDEEDYKKVPVTERVKVILEQAAEKLKLANTTGWVVHHHAKEINPELTYREQHLKEIVVLEWHKREGGGGARASFQN